MRQRHSQNPNLVLHYGSVWNGLPVQAQKNGLVVNYLEGILDVMTSAVDDDRQVSMFRFDIRLPSEARIVYNAFITRVFASLNAQIQADQHRKARAGKRVYPCRLRCVWVKERDTSDHVHYHCAAFVNRECYFTLGRFDGGNSGGWDGVDIPVDPRREPASNMAERINNAVASALNCAPWQVRGLVHFPENPVYAICEGSADYVRQFEDAFHRISYFAKADTKKYGDGSNAFGCSRG